MEKKAIIKKQHLNAGEINILTINMCDVIT